MSMQKRKNSLRHINRSHTVMSFTPSAPLVLKVGEDKYIIARCSSPPGVISPDVMRPLQPSKVRNSFLASSGLQHS